MSSTANIFRVSSLLKDKVREYKVLPQKYCASKQISNILSITEQYT